jgi:hypothetical protein
MSVPASGARLPWTEVPAYVRRAVTEIVGGGPIVSASSQPGGFSPGTADRLLTTTGRRAFVKAASPAQNVRTPDIHRTEARVVAGLPESPHLPRLLGTYDDGEWFAAVYADIDGRLPRTPWQPAEIEAAAAALTRIARLGTPNPVPGLESLSVSFAPEYGGWARLRADPAPDMDRWVLDRLDLLCDLAELGIAALAGDSLTHCDTRADNLIVRPDGRIVVIDWPWASAGAPWFDLLCLAINVDFVGGGDPEDLVARWLPDVNADALTGALGGLCGYFLDAARNPPPIGLPTVRAFQAAQGLSTLRWLRRRVG